MFDGAVGCLSPWRSGPEQVFRTHEGDNRTTISQLL
jgi:hypothetical protein